MLKVNWSYFESANKYATEQKKLQYGLHVTYTSLEEYSFQK